MKEFIAVQKYYTEVLRFWGFLNNPDKLAKFEDENLR
jgi:hypothetical protein